MKGQVLHLLRVHLKVPDDSSDFSVLLTKKSLMFLFRLNEMSGGSEKILLVSLSFILFSSNISNTVVSFLIAYIKSDKLCKKIGGTYSEPP